MEALLLRHPAPLELGNAGLQLWRAHVGPDHAAALDAGVGRDPDPVLEVALRWLGRHVDAAAIEVVFPAVVDAAQSALLVAAKEERGAAVRAILLHQPDAA